MKSKIYIHPINCTDYKQVKEILNKQEKSTHYIIGIRGEKEQILDEADTAWHTGNSEDDNCSISIYYCPYIFSPAWTATEYTIDSLILLCTELSERYELGLLEVNKNLFGNFKQIQDICDYTNSNITGIPILKADPVPWHQIITPNLNNLIKGKNYSGWCLEFVQTAFYGKGNGFRTANDAWNASDQFTGDPPKGVYLIVFSGGLDPQGAAHIAYTGPNLEVYDSEMYLKHNGQPFEWNYWKNTFCGGYRGWGRYCDTNKTLVADGNAPAETPTDTVIPTDTINFMGGVADPETVLTTRQIIL